MMKGSPFIIQPILVLFFVFNSWTINVGIAQFDNVHIEYPALNNKLLKDLTAIIETRSGDMLIGSKYNGIYKFDNAIFNSFTTDTKVQNILKYVELNCIFEDKDESIWIGTSEGYLHLEKDGSFIDSHMIFDNRNHPWNNIQDLYIDERRIMWAATYEGLAKIYLQNQIIELFHPEDISSTPFPGHEKRLNCLIQDPLHYDRIWLGSRYGLKSFNKLNDSFTYYESPPKWHEISPEIQKYSIVNMTMDNKGALYLASRSSGGIMKYDPNHDQWTQFLYKGGLKTDPYTVNGVNTISIAGDSIVFFGCDEGAGYLDFASHELIPFNNEIKENSWLLLGSIIDREDQLWFAGRYGLSKINLAEITYPNESQIPLIKAIKANEFEIDEIDEKLKLDKEVEELAFHLSITKPYLNEENIFSWKLSPIDEDWITSEANGKANYKKLKGGKYVFNYRFRNSSGYWIEGSPTEIYIKKEWHESIGLLLLITSVFLMLVGFITYFIVRQIKKNSEQKLAYEKKLADAELTALRSQMNPHFIFNSLNSIYNFIHNNETENAAEYLAKFSKLMRLVLHNSTEKLVSLEDELQLLNLYLELEKIRFNNMFDYHLHINSDIDPIATLIPPMLLQPYLENAIWHGLMHKKAKGLLTLDISKSQDGVLFTIKDNGIGRDQSKIINASNNKKSMGMKINKKRIESFEILYGKAGNVNIIDLKNENGKAIGTRVEIILPLMTKEKMTTQK